VDEGSIIGPFQLGRIPRIEFGSGRLELLPDVVAGHGRQAALVTGKRSFRSTERWAWLLGELERRDVAVETVTVDGEPSPELVDTALARLRPAGIEVVVGIGGGSVLDAAKAIAGLVATTSSARDHLEGVGPGLPYNGPNLPLVAVPTTAGTGSEATRNAVLSERGPSGFKRSFRHERLVATDAIVDPDLLRDSPKAAIGPSGMDAFTQLLEAFVSLRASPLTDALARSGLAAARDGLLAWHAEPDGPGAPAARTRMAYAALLSGICLANAGLGVIHGLAAPLGAHFPIPHGAACGAVAVASVEANIVALEARAAGAPALGKLAETGRLLARDPALGDVEARAALVTELRRWQGALGVPGLATWGVRAADVDQLVAGSRGSSMRTNPIELTDAEVGAVVRASL
jgi:alcohol dehydrogenase